MFKTKKEKMAFRIGCIVTAKKQKQKCGSKMKSKQFSHRQNVMKNEKPHFLGPTFVNGKFYDTNFKKPVEIPKSRLKGLHEEYDVSGKDTDQMVVDRFVKHMQRKFGFFDKNHRFIGIMGDD